MCDKVKQSKINIIPKNFVIVHNQGTQVVVVEKLKTAEEDRLLKKAIKEDYKHVFRDVVIVRTDQIDKKYFGNDFKGRTIAAVEFRTFLSEEKNIILKKVLSPLMSFSRDAYLKNNVYNKKKSTIEV